MKRLQRRKQDCPTGPCLAKPFPIAHSNGPNCTATSSCAAQRAVVHGLAPACATQLSHPHTVIIPQAPDHVNGDSRPWNHAPNATFEHMCNCTLQPQADQIHAPCQQMPPIPALLMPLPPHVTTDCNFCSLFWLCNTQTANPHRPAQHTVELASAIQPHLLSFQQVTSTQPSHIINKTIGLAQSGSRNLQSLLQVQLSFEKEGLDKHALRRDWCLSAPPTQAFGRLRVHG